MIKTKLCLLIGVAGLALAATPGLAASMAHVSVSPVRPKVHDRITATIRVSQPLAKGWHWVYSLVGNPSGSTCASFAQETSRQRGTKGKTLSFSLVSEDDIIVAPGDVLAPAQQWCAGRASILIEKDRNSDRNDAHAATVGSASFRINR